MITNAPCWQCSAADKESVLTPDGWKLTRTAYCLATGSAANGRRGYYRRVYKDTIQKECSEFEEIKPLTAPKQGNE